jgi:hypothetical protein
MNVGTSVDTVRSFDFPLFGKEGSRDVLGHIEVPSVDDCIYYIFLYVPT